MSNFWNRLNPRRVIQAVDGLPQLQKLVRDMHEGQKTMQRELRAVGRRLDSMSAQLASQQKLLDEFPELRARVRQCLAMPRYDERQAVRLAESRLDMTSVGRDMKAAVAGAELLTQPFPHLDIPQLIPDSLYRELLDSLPVRIFFDHLPPNRQELRVPFDFVPAYTRKIWHEYVVPLVERDLLPALLEKFRPVLNQRIKESWPDLPNDGQDLRFTVLNSRLLLRLPGYEIKPHRDPRWAFVTCLIYLPKPTDATVYGTHLYRLVHEREAPSGSPFWLEYADCELVKSVPGSAHSALAFVNWSGAHSASMPGDAPAGTHRYLYQLQIGPDSASRERIMTHVAADRRSAWASREDY